MRWLLWLYPRRWRRRYRPEMEALLDEMPPTPRNVLDLLGGALDARLRGQWPRQDWRRQPSAIVVAAAVSVAALLVIGVWLRLGLAQPVVGLALAASAIAALRLLTAYRRRRRRRWRWGRGYDGGECAPIPAKPLPDAPPTVTAASPGSGRRSDRD